MKKYWSRPCGLSDKLGICDPSKVPTRLLQSLQERGNNPQSCLHYLGAEPCLGSCLMMDVPMEFTTVQEGPREILKGFHFVYTQNICLFSSICEGISLP